jgi:hypothetical protein
MHWRSRPVPNLGSGSVSGYPTYRELQRFGSCYTLTGRGQVMPPDIWIGTIEISWTNEETPNVFKPAFTVVTTWATSSEEFREKCARMLESYGWKLLEVDRANPVPENVVFDEEVEDMLERTRSNPNAIIYGTFHSYPVM